MIDRALLYLLLMRAKNALLSLRRRPGRLILTLLLVGVFVASIVARRSVGEVENATRLTALVWILGLYFLLSLVAGLGEPGPVFPPADVDFVLPAPFARRHLLIYHLLRHYAQMLLLALFYGVVLGVGSLPRPWLALLGTWLCLLVCTHVQTAGTLLAARLGDHVFGRLRTASRVALVLLLAGGVLAGVAALVGVGDLGKTLEASIATGAVRTLLYPAVAVADLAVAPDLGAAMRSLLGLLGLLVASFGFVLLFPVDFLETAVTRTEKKRRAEGRARRAVRSQAALHGVFGGAGAIAWVNALTLRRRLRMVVGALVMLLFVMLISGTRGRAAAASGIPQVVILLALLPLFANLPIGFRGHREHLEMLKTLPLRPAALAFGEIAVPVLVLCLLQLAMLSVFVVAGRLDAVWLGIAALLYPVVDVGAVAIADLFQLGRDRRTLGLLVATGQMLAIGLSLAPGVFAAAWVYAKTASVGGALVAAFVAQILVDVVLVRLLGRHFARYEVGAS